MNIIRETQSICPICLKPVQSFVAESKGNVFLLKKCQQHGESKIVLSRNPELYKNLDRYFFDIMGDTKKLSEYELWVTLRCNMNCIICHLEDETQNCKAEPTLSEIEECIKRNRASSYVLSGGEPACRDDLDKIIQLFKKHHKFITIHTNGLKLADTQYLNKLKQAGLNRINLQFDGFNRETYRIFRGRDILDMKLKALENLKALNMATDLNVTIAKRINDDDSGTIVDYAVKNDFINGVNFFTICFLGGIKDWPLDNYIMPDEVVDILEQKTNHKITKKNIFLFQKLHLAVKSWQKQRFCLYSQIYILVRSNNSYEPIDKYLNLPRAEFWLDKYKDVYKKNKFLAKIMLFVFLPFSLIRWSTLKIFKDLLLTGFSYFFQTPYYLKSKRFLYLNFSTGCDPHKVDYSLLCNCQDEIIYLDGKTGRLENQGCDGLRSISLEQRRILAKSQKT